MKLDCLAFRTLLEKKLVGRPDPSSLSELSWHAHLVDCGDCRAFFEGEEALEALLATWPEPRLSPEIKRRVLVALAKSKRTAVSLDALLERDAAFATPENLAARILAGLEKSRGAAAAQALDPLDRLLDRAGGVTVPPALERRVLAALAAERAPARRPVLAWRRSAWTLAAAAVLVVTLVVWLANRREEADVRPITAQNEPTAAPDTQMLAALDVLENWDLLMESDDVDALISTLGTADEVLLDYQDEG
jgi:predicted anti-sigma-YlaC factor YlaD